jgi:hypothetical protein
MKIWGYLATAACAVAITPANAAISVSGVNASSTFDTYNVINVINGSGLSGGLHDGDFNNKWMADLDDITPTLTFDLGAEYTLTNTVIWNYGGGCCGTERNANGVNISLSSDNVNFVSIGSFDLARQNSDPFGSETFTLAGTGRYVRFGLLGNFGGRYTGLAEVQFNGTISDAIPEPATWAMMIGGFGLVGAASRRRTRTALAHG